MAGCDFGLFTSWLSAGCSTRYTVRHHFLDGALLFWSFLLRKDKAAHCGSPTYILHNVCSVTWCNMVVYIIHTSCIISWDDMADHHCTIRHQAILPRCYPGASACYRAVAWWIFGFCCCVSGHSLDRVMIGEKYRKVPCLPSFRLWKTCASSQRPQKAECNCIIWNLHVLLECLDWTDAKVGMWKEDGHWLKSISGQCACGPANRFFGQASLAYLAYIYIINIWISSNTVLTIWACSGNSFLAEEHGARFAAQLHVDLDLVIPGIHKFCWTRNFYYLYWNILK